MKFFVVLALLLFAFCNVLCQTNLESAFLNIPNTTFIKSFLWDYVSQPHLAGTRGSFLVANYTYNKMLEYGLSNVSILESQALMTYPIRRSVRLIEPVSYEASMYEPPVPGDITSNNTQSVMTYLGYSASGTVEGQLVYANYGSKDDFDYLASMNISVRGRIVIARYGAIFRGIKAYNCENAGCIGLIIYSDPADDGFVRGETWPEGPWRPPKGVQRGSLQYLFRCPGSPDPSRYHECFDGEPEPLVPSIPALPLSYEDAQPLLENIKGLQAPPSWRGGLNLTYNIGPGPSKVVLSVELEKSTRTIYDVCGEIPGSIEPDRVILLGNHHDAWVFGATDPSSGSATMLEIIRSFNILKNETSWEPRRTIRFCSWDAEEHALIGSTWYGENQPNLNTTIVAYLNVDTAATGSNFGASCTPSLQPILQHVTGLVSDPASPNKTIGQAWNGICRPMGSGSDFTVFIHHLGISSMDLGFSGIGAGVYHSVYDGYSWLSEKGDPGFLYQQAMAKIWGLVALSLANDKVVPFSYRAYSEALYSYLTVIERLLGNETEVKLEDLKTAIDRFWKTADRLESDKRDLLHESDLNKISKFNDKLSFVDRRYFVVDEGLPGRYYFKYLIHGPSFLSGYSGIPFPGVYESIQAQNWTRAREAVETLSDSLSNAARDLEGPAKIWIWIIVIVAILLFFIILFAIVVFLRRDNKFTEYVQ